MTGYRLFQLARVFARFARLCPALCLTTCCSMIASCDRPPDPQDHRTQPPQEHHSARSQAAQPPLEPIAHVPVGEFLVGSRPGEPGRRPELEPLEERRKLGPFRIDAFPYPGDPNQPIRLNASHSEAEALCAERQGRLCTELEWERACRGSASSRYPKGDDACSPNELCVSGFEVARMTTLLEWTNSTFDEQSPHEGKVVVRGADARLGDAERRCARRSAAAGTDTIAFRCCYGAPNAAHLDEPELGAPYRETQLSTDELRALLGQDERTRPLARSARFFEPESVHTVLARGPGNTQGFTLTASPVIWQPARGSRFLVLVGHSEPRTSFVLAYYMGRDQRILAGSFIMTNETGPIALAYAPSIRPRIHFSGCWGCPGETGKILFREPEELVLLQP